MLPPEIIIIIILAGALLVAVSWPRARQRMYSRKAAGPAKRGQEIPSREQ